MKNILYWFIEGQTHVGMPRGPKNEFDPLCTEIDCFSFKFKTTSEHAPQLQRI